ncbi:MAG: Adenine DNA glycosylase [Chlamydiia bacterium]|nr:Adenine DNA glycosylase [Chlamydiia bacterium]MCH9618536.1 Adenine DNA glycosylase [Chlamydiia bacterium]MCH9624244.1 Adenine DNA glycosylase [Chlamydiia bacterium]
MEMEYIERLTKWFTLVKRDFPWRRDRSAYYVLVSEIMLQQTKAATVLAFFYAWMEKFPDFATLAKASEEEVIKAWEGLGYYSRARNLRLIARGVMVDFGGVFPHGIEDILSFKGIGPYTAAAISHFAFNKRAIGADGNIKKVIARFYGHKQRVDKGSAILDLLDEFLPKSANADAFEALIELGATVCSKKPKCSLCPLQGECISFQEGLTDVIPVVKKAVKMIPLTRRVFILEHENGIVIKKEDKRLMQGLYELPYIEIPFEKDLSLSIKEVEKKFVARLRVVDHLDSVTHTFTKYRAHLKPIICRITNNPVLPAGYIFVKRGNLKDLPFSSGHRKIISTITCN